MSCYPFEDWMTDFRMLDSLDAYEHVCAARGALHGWSDAEVRRAERCLRSIGEANRTRAGAQRLEARPPRRVLRLVSRLTESQRLAVNILRLVAAVPAEPEDRARLDEEFRRLSVIQAEESTRKEVAPKVKMADSLQKRQSKIAKNLRGRVGDNGESMDALINRLVRSHPGMAAIELWPRLGSSIKELTGDDGCVEKHKDHRKRLDDAFYEYESPKSKKGVATIGYPTFRDMVGAVRKEKRPE